MVNEVIRIRITIGAVFQPDKNRLSVGINGNRPLLESGQTGRCAIKAAENKTGIGPRNGGSIISTRDDIRIIQPLVVDVENTRRAGKAMHARHKGGPTRD